MAVALVSATMRVEVFTFSTELQRVTSDRGGAQTIFTVADNGTGIATEDLPKVCEKFYQVDADHAGQVRGFGLGLYYAREFVRQHGAGIAIDSTLGKGTTVTVTIPLVPTTP